MYGMLGSKAHVLPFSCKVSVVEWNNGFSNILYLIVV